MTRDVLTKKIEESQAHVVNDVRDYIGASIIGSDCLRQIWYEFKGTPAEDVPSKTIRTWAIGKHLEGLVLDWLETAGIKLLRKWLPLSSLRVPFFRGHIDAVSFDANQIPKDIIEVKTAKDTSFNTFVKKGVKEWNPQYYAQIQSYMGMSEIINTYILVLNKDNSELSDEFVTFDPVFYRKLEDRALMVGEAYGPPPRVHSSPLWYQCKLCKFRKVCHK